jgi:hypothetical protein
VRVARIDSRPLSHKGSVILELGIGHITHPHKTDL